MLAAGISGCEAEKSRNPLSPNVAGPIAGVSISPPTPVNPVNAEVLNTGPVRLVFNNASTNGERPIFYVVELASDAAFTNKVFAQSKVTPGSGTQTSIVVDAALTAERTYYWRAKADDGANESDYSSVAKFDIVVPVVIEAPVPVSPVSGAVASSTSPGAGGEQRRGPGPRGKSGLLVRGRAGSGVRENHRRAWRSNAAAERRRARRCPSCRGARSSSGASSGSGSMER